MNNRWRQKHKYENTQIKKNIRKDFILQKKYTNQEINVNSKETNINL
jgi:hypothetical protein